MSSGAAFEQTQVHADGYNVKFFKGYYKANSKHINAKTEGHFFSIILSKVLMDLRFSQESR